MCRSVDRHLNRFTRELINNLELSWDVKNNFGIESVPDVFFQARELISDKALRRKIGLTSETKLLSGLAS